LHREQSRHISRQIDLETEATMRRWQVQEAKMRLSALLAASRNEGPQLVTRRGAEVAVVVEAETWRRLQNAQRPDLKELLLADSPRFDLDLPGRGKRRRRPPAPV
jgi:antitoxin Phd